MPRHHGCWMRASHLLLEVVVEPQERRQSAGGGERWKSTENQEITNIHKIQNIKLKTLNTKYKIQNKIQNEIQNKIQNIKYKIENTKYKIQNKIQNEIQNKIQNTKYKMENIKYKEEKAASWVWGKVGTAEDQEEIESLWKETTAKKIPQKMITKKRN